MPVGKNLNLKREKIIPEKENQSEKEPNKVKKVIAKASKKKSENKKTSKENKVSKKPAKLSIKAEVKSVDKTTKKESAATKPKVAIKEVIKKEEIPSPPPSESIIEALEQKNKASYKVEIIPSRRKAVKKTNVELSGALVISNADSIKTEIKDVFTEYTIISIILKDVEELDLSILQLLYMYKTKYEMEGKEVTIMTNLPNPLKELISVNGFSSLLFPVINKS